MRKPTILSVGIVLVLVLVPLLAVPQPVSAARVTIYVHQAATGAATGNSWGDAYPTLQQALDRTNAAPTTDYEIWVAEGAYYPDEGGGRTNNDRTESFLIHRDNVRLYGGFAGTENALEERDPGAHPTILSGDIDQNGSLSGNAYHVVVLDGMTYEGLTSATVIDGVTISGGNASGGGDKGNGGGLACAGALGGECSPTLAHVTFSGNYAAINGGGMISFGQDGTSSPVLTNVTFSGNVAGQHGGGMANDGSSDGVSRPVLTNVTFSGNRAGGSGGAIYAGGSAIKGTTNLTLHNSILWGNTASTGDQIATDYATLTISHSAVKGGCPTGADCDTVLNVDPLFVAPVAASEAPTTGGNYRLQVPSPVIDAGDNSAVPADALDLDGDGSVIEALPYDLDGHARLRDADSVYHAVVDMGAYETQRLYIDADASGADDGAWWGSAYTTLQAALDEANAHGGHATCEIWVAQGIYTPDAGPGRTDNDPATSFRIEYDNVRLYGGFGGGENNRDARDPVAYVTVLSGDIGGDDVSDAHGVVSTISGLRGTNAHHVLWLDGVAGDPITTDTVIDGVTITAGDANPGPVERNGGGLFCDGRGSGRECSPTLTHVTFSGNRAYLGGGMYNGAGTGTSSPVLSHVTFSGNGAGYGGGMASEVGSGGISHPALTHVTFSGNHAAAAGGGMYNQVGSGAGSPTLTYVLFSGNKATENGGGLATAASGLSTPLLTHVTFAGNRAGISGGAMFNSGSSSGTTQPVLKNVIFWGNTAPTDAQMKTVSAAPTVTHSVIEGGCPTGATCDAVVDADPRFITPVDAGGAPTTGGNYRLQGPSPAIDTGDNDAVPTGITTDLDGHAYLRDGDSDGSATVDMGAYEYQRLYVDADAGGANDGSTWTDAYTYLQDALAATHGGVQRAPCEIWVAEGVYAPDQGAGHVAGAVTETFRITWDNVRLYGGFAGVESEREQRDPAAHVTVLSGDVDGNDVTDAHGVVTTTEHITGTNAYHVLWLDGVAGDPITADTVIDGVSITAGDAHGSSRDLNGGGVYCDGHGSENACSPTLAHVTFSANSADGAGGGLYVNGSDSGTSNPTLSHVAFTGNQALSGGGMANHGTFGTSSPVLTHVVFSNNAATHNGGAMYNHANSGTSSPMLVNVAFRGNQAMIGGAVYNEASNSGTTSPVLTNVLFSGNAATTSGGALLNYGSQSGTSSPVLTHVTFAGNHATHGGGMYSVSANGGISSPELTNCILWGNAAETAGAQIHNASATVTLTYSLLEGDCPAGTTCGTGVIHTDPLFVAQVAAAEAPTIDGDYRLGTGSPAIDAGNNSAVPVEVVTDLDGGPRFADIPAVADTGSGSAPVVDMGAYEARLDRPPFFTSTPVTSAVADEPYTYAVTVDDPDLIHGDILTLTAPTLPGWLTVSQTGTTTGMLFGTPARTDAGSHAVELSVTDAGGASATQTFTITVSQTHYAVYLPLALRGTP